MNPPDSRPGWPGISRATFLRGAAGALGACVLGGPLQAQNTPEKPEKMQTRPIPSTGAPLPVGVWGTRGGAACGEALLRSAKLCDERSWGRAAAPAARRRSRHCRAGEPAVRRRRPDPLAARPALTRLGCGDRLRKLGADPAQVR